MFGPFNRRERREKRWDRLWDGKGNFENYLTTQDYRTMSAGTNLVRTAVYG